MRFTILQLLLWPKDPSKVVRSIDFEPGKINVITGWSRTGKSAIGSIIDYCLGSEKCSIPVGHIRDKVEWFGLFVSIDDSCLLIARRDPGGQQQSGDYCIIDALEMHFPLRPEKNAHLDDFKAKMNRVAGLPSLVVEIGEADTDTMGAASFRDMAALNFLPQHIVANPYVLFFKADTVEHREKLKIVFPLMLGVIDSAYLEALHEQRLLERERRQLGIEIAQRKKANEAWQAQVFGLHARARELGLLSGSRNPKGLEEYILELAEIPVLVSAGSLPSLELGATEAAVERLEALRERERQLDRKIGDGRRRLARLESLKMSVSDYDSTLIRQRSRIRGLGWFKEKIGSNKGECPVCGSREASSVSEIQRLSQAAEVLEIQTRSFGGALEGLEKEKLGTVADVRDLERELRAVRIERLEIEARRQESEGAGQRLEEVYRFVGRLEQALESMRELDADGVLLARLEEVEDGLALLGVRLDEPGRRTREERALERISRNIGYYAKFMSLERSEDIVRLRIRDLTLTFESEGRGRVDLLWEIGSGANWMGYHIAAFLALHEFLKSHKPSGPVPGFLVVDQPSQVYFPSDYFARNNGEADAALSEDDLVATRRIFETLSQGLDRMQGDFQIIVTEHADESAWGDVANVVMVANWRDDADRLIPKSWLE